MKTKYFVIMMIVACIMIFAGCESGSETDTPETTKETTTIAPTEEATDVNETEAPIETPAENETEAPSETPAMNNILKKVTGGADKVGIYAVVVRLDKGAADKGTIELVYHGAKGTPQENSIVNTFRIEYYKEEAGTYEINTYFDGEVYQNLHHKDEMKVTNEFGATLRAGGVVISYTPDGGETREIFRADAEYFR